jgi:hypothetical protein
MHHSGWWPDYVGRLFRQAGAFFHDHGDRLIVRGAVGRLSSPFIRNHLSLDRLIDKMNKCSATARNMEAGGASIFTALFHGGWASFCSYFCTRPLTAARPDLAISTPRTPTTAALLLAGREERK